MTISLVATIREGDWEKFGMGENLERSFEGYTYKCSVRIFWGLLFS
jgi:hypothetical protein